MKYYHFSTKVTKINIINIMILHYLTLIKFNKRYASTKVCPRRATLDNNNNKYVST